MTFWSPGAPALDPTGLGNELIDDQCAGAAINGSVERHERLGGMLNY